MKVYISGQISNLPIEEAKENFRKAEDILRKKGFEPVNPFNSGLPVTATWHEHMRADIKMMLECDAICLLPNWERSQGARLEEHIAMRLSMACMIL